MGLRADRYYPAMEAARARSLLETAESARASARMASDAAALDAFERDYPSMLDALDWFIDRGQPDEAGRLASALVPFWMATKRIDDGNLAFERVLAVDTGTPGRHARTLYEHGYLVFWAGLDETAAPRFEAARELAIKVGDPDLVALALAGLARIALRRDTHEAVRLLREALAATEALPDSSGRSSALHVLGVALQMSGDFDGAHAVMSERLERARATGDETVVYVESANLSMVERQRGDLAAAESLSRDALRIIAGRRDELAVGWVINGLAAVTAARGQDERAAVLLGLAESLLERAGGEWPPDELEQHDGTLRALTERLGIGAIDRARSDASGMTFEAAVAFALEERVGPPQASRS